VIIALEWMVFSLIAGLVAKAIMPGKDPGKLIGTTALGMVGALNGGYLGRQMGLYDGADPVGFIMAVIDAIVLLILYRWLSA
jgi:uncharacterized membrane protein YeaQ/YmgE (transglycosylase-associated protein family)